MLLLPGMNAPPNDPDLSFKAKLHFTSSKESSLGEGYRVLDGPEFETVLCPLLSRTSQAGF